MISCIDLEFPVYKFVGALNNLVFASGHIRAKRVERRVWDDFCPILGRKRCSEKKVVFEKQNKVRRELEK